MRTFLIDQLARISPLAAAEYSRVILRNANSADEWALALRNLARADQTSEARALLEQKTDELLSNALWQQNLTTGYLEAFDVAVFVGGTNLVPALCRLVRKHDNPPVSRAAFLALDRLVINDPATVLSALADQPDLMEGRELTRAGFFARLDVRDSHQQQLLENYLLNPRLGVRELEQFAGVFPNANYMVSHNLLTHSRTPDYSAVVAQDAESLRQVQKWLAEPRFVKLQPQLQKVKQRLEVFARQANSNRPRDSQFIVPSHPVE